MDYDNDDMNKNEDDDVDPFSNIQESNSPEKKRPDTPFQNEPETQVSENFLQHNFWKTEMFNVEDILDEIE
jgi:hypothetical protein